MNTPEENDPIDALLREQNFHVEDGGFTARVIKILPRRRRMWLRPALLLGATAVGSVLAVLWLPWGNLPALDLSAFLSPNSQVLLPWVLVFAVVGSLIFTEWKIGVRFGVRLDSPKHLLLCCTHS
jgi:hypothetical protein